MLIPFAAPPFPGFDKVPVPDTILGKSGCVLLGDVIAAVITIRQRPTGTNLGGVKAFALNMANRQPAFPFIPPTQFTIDAATVNQVFKVLFSQLATSNPTLWGKTELLFLGLTGPNELLPIHRTGHTLN